MCFVLRFMSENLFFLPFKLCDFSLFLSTVYEISLFNFLKLWVIDHFCLRWLQYVMSKFILYLLLCSEFLWVFLAVSFFYLACV
jgi:hypothetical protein